MHMQEKINQVYTKQNFITWLKGLEQEYVFEENSFVGNSLYVFGLQYGIPDNSRLHFVDIYIPNEIDGDFDTYSLPEWISKFYETTIDYYYNDNDSSCNVSVRQMLMYFGES